MAGGPEVQSHHQLHSEFKASPKYKRSLFQKNNPKDLYYKDLYMKMANMDTKVFNIINS